MSKHEYEVTDVEKLVDTHDMGLAIALVTDGYDLVALETQPHSRRVIFRFRWDKSIDQKTQSYWSGRMTVDAKTFWNESKNLKTRLYSL